MAGSSPGALAQQLVEGAQRRDGRPQLVRDVGHELAAPVTVRADDVDGLLESLRHVIERPGQLGQLRRSELVDRHADIQPSFGQRPGRVRQAPHRAGQPLREQDGRDDRCSQRGDGRAEHHVDERGHRLFPERERARQRHRDQADGSGRRILGVVHVRNLEHGGGRQVVLAGLPGLARIRCQRYPQGIDRVGGLGRFGDRDGHVGERHRGREVPHEAGLLEGPVDRVARPEWLFLEHRERIAREGRDHDDLVAHEGRHGTRARLEVVRVLPREIVVELARQGDEHDAQGHGNDRADGQDQAYPEAAEERPHEAHQARSTLREGVAGAADGQDERRIPRIVLQLLAQVADVDVDGLLILVQCLVVADELQQLPPGEDPTGP